MIFLTQTKKTILQFVILQKARDKNREFQKKMEMAKKSKEVPTNITRI